MLAQNLKKIEETQKQLEEKEETISVKNAEIEELKEELEIAENEICPPWPYPWRWYMRNAMYSRWFKELLKRISIAR